MKKVISILYLIFISCEKSHDHPCEDLNNEYIMKLYRLRGEQQKERSMSVLNEWINELRDYGCSPKFYYEYYDEIVNKN